MTRREAAARTSVVASAAAGGVILLWSAWRVLTAPLPTAAATAAWLLWGVSVVALVTFVLYLREMARHGLGSRHASWKPLPGVLLLWVGGLTALVAFGFVLPDRPGDTAQPDVDTAATSPSTTAAPAPAATSAPRTSPTTPRATRAAVAPARATSQPQPVSTPSTVQSTTRTATSAPSPTSTTPTPTATTTTTPLLDIVLPPGRGHAKPPHTR
ncbi:hypothetical protein [Pedococcus sp. 2YAF34]|uniref:hypothetical protein n=1 Tax=Pedococcus sp. 2YAF34 TaxID=3233032 RepID=UPI003F99FA93